MSEAFLSTEGDSALVISFPHVGTAIPAELARDFQPRAFDVVDTDWHVDRLYDFARTHGASTVQARLSRYVIDLNRPPDGASLYPGQTTTGLCPTETFAGEPLYLGVPPGAEAIAARREQYWQPYHDELARLVARAKARHGHATLLDAHSIASFVPRLFDGRLPDINVGTNSGHSCSPVLTDVLIAKLAGQDEFTHVVNGRFKGGYITRHYGRPETGVHAVQIELGQDAYIDAPLAIYREARAASLKALLQRLVEVLKDFAPSAPGR